MLIHPAWHAVSARTWTAWRDEYKNLAFDVQLPAASSPSPTKIRTTKMTHAHWKEELLKVVNVAAYLFFLGSHFYYTVFSPQPIYENIKQTYFSPTIWGFLVWPIIHILLLGTVIYQFTSARGKTVVVHGISWEFPIVITLYGIFIVAWANHHYIAAFITSLLLVYIIALISMTLRKDLLPQSVGDELLVHLPFAACQAWSVFIGYLAAFQAFGIDAAEHQNGVFTDFFVFFAL